MPAESSLAWIVAGGTGGHLYPGVAVARELRVLRDPTGAPWEVLFVVRKRDRGLEVLRRENFTVAQLAGEGLSRRPSLRWFTFPFKIVLGFLGACQLIWQTKPKVILGMGGYLTFPTLLAGRLLGVRVLIHEQNVIPGLANRLVSRFTDGIAVSFAESLPSFPAGKAWVSGLPVRQNVGQISREAGRTAFRLPEQTFTFLVFGGSQGAHRLNVMMLEVWRTLMGRSAGFQVIHITGESDHSYLKGLYRGFSFQSVVLPYCHQMAEAYAAADVVVCRAGASTIAELIAARKPAVLVPYPFASNNHQWFNAEVLSRRGLAEVFPEKDLTPEAMARTLQGYLTNPERVIAIGSRYGALALPAVGTEAARKIALFMR